MHDAVTVQRWHFIKHDCMSFPFLIKSHQKNITHLQPKSTVVACLVSLLDCEPVASVFLMTRGDIFLPQERARCTAKIADDLEQTSDPVLSRIQGHH